MAFLLFTAMWSSVTQQQKNIHVIPAKARIQRRATGFRVKLGMTGEVVIPAKAGIHNAL